MSRNAAQYPAWVSPSTKRAWSALPPHIREEMRAACEKFGRDPRSAEFWSRTGQGKLAADILSKLLKGVSNLHAQDREGAINPVKVADFLAWIACCEEESDLLWVVKTGLKGLGIARKENRGRPKGRRFDYDYFLECTAWVQSIERLGLWALKESLRSETPHRWQTRLYDILGKAKWSEEEIEAVIFAKSVRYLAIRLTANHFGKEYDTIQKAVRRYSRVLSAGTRTGRKSTT